MNKENQADIEPSEIFPERERDFYQKFRNNIRIWYQGKGSKHKWAEYIILAPDLFHLMVKLTLDPDVPRKHKFKIAAVVAYFISPIDLLPELFLGPIGFLDEIVLTAYVLDSILNVVDPEIIRKHWAGEEDILWTVKRILGIADVMVGSGMYRKLVNRYGSGRGRGLQ